MGGFSGGGHQGFSAPHPAIGIRPMGSRPMGSRPGDGFHDRDHRFFDHGRFGHDRFAHDGFDHGRFDHDRFDHDHFFHHHNRFFFGFDFVSFGFPYWWYPWYPYDWYPYDNYGYSDYSPVYDYRYWYGLATAVQTELTARGYYHGQIDGVIGSDSRNAIQAFQQAQRLPVTGMIDPKLLKALKLPQVPRVS